MLATMSGLFLADIVLYYVLVVRALIRAERHDYLVCIHCGYLHEGLGDEGICPECGRKFYKERTRTLWMDEYSKSALLYGKCAFTALWGWLMPGKSRKNH